MLKTTPLVLAALLGARLTPALAQATPDELNENADAPFVRHLRPDRPALSQTITAGVLRPGEFQLELGADRLAALGTGLPTQGGQATLRIGFWNSMEWRLSQGYDLRPELTLATEAAPARLSPGTWQPLVVGAKLMLTPDRASRFQASLLAEAAVPQTGQGEQRRSTWAPGGRLLLSQQLGRRAALEGNLGYNSTGVTAQGLLNGQFPGAAHGSLLLSAPLGDHAGFFAEGYGRGGREALTTGATGGLYYRPWTGLRFDAALGRVLGGPGKGRATAGVGMSLRLGGNGAR